MTKSYKVKHLDRTGSETEDIVWAFSLKAARKKAEEQFDDVIDVARSEDSGIVMLCIGLLLAAAFLVVVVKFS